MARYNYNRHRRSREAQSENITINTDGAGYLRYTDAQTYVHAAGLMVNENQSLTDMFSEMQDRIDELSLRVAELEARN
jgi:hypothetical protein